MAHGYAIGSALTGLSTTAFTFTNWTPSNIAFLNDGAMDRACTTGASTGSTRYITIDFGTARSLVGFAFLNHNLATWSLGAVQSIDAADNSAITVNAVNAKAGVSYNDINDAPNNKEFVLQFPAVSRRYWRIAFISTTTEALRLGEILALTSVTTLSRLAAYGRQSSEFYAVNRTESSTGNVRSTYLAGPVRSLRLPFVDMQGTSQREELMAMWRATNGGASNLLWIETVESTTGAATAAGIECVFGKLQPALSYRETDYTIFDVDALELRSLGRDVGR